MRGLLLAFAALFVVACEPPPQGPAVAAATTQQAPPSPDAVTFVYAPESVGEKCEETLTKTSTTTTTEGTNKVTVTESKSIRSSYEVLAVANDTSTKELVRYDQYDLVPKDPDASLPKLGKSYVVSLEEGALAVTDQGNQQVLGPERVYFMENWSLGKKERFGARLDKRTVRPKESIPELTAAFKERLDESWKVTVKSATFTFAGREADRARIDYAVDADGLSEEGLPTTLKVRGKLFLSIPRGMLVLNEEERDVTIVAPGAGKLESHETFRQERKRTLPGAQATVAK